MLLPASVSIFALFAAQLIDKILAGRLMGESALSAATLFTPVFSLIFFCGTIISVGGLVCYTFNIGRGNKPRALDFFGLSVILSVIVGVAFALLLYFGKGFFFAGSNIVPEVRQRAFEFALWFPLLALVAPLTQVLHQMVYADGDGKVSMASCLVLLGGNVVFSVILCDHIGLSGIVLGSVVSSVLSILVSLLHFLRKSNSLRFVLHFNVRDTLAIFRYSAVEVCDFLLLGFLFFVMNHFCLAYYDADYLAVFSVMTDVIEFSIMLGAVWQAAEPVVNVYRGEGNAKAIRGMMSHVNVMMFVVAVFSAILLVAIAPLVVQIFHIQTPKLIDETIGAIRTISIGALGIAFLKLYACYHLHEHPVYALVLVMIFLLVAPITMMLLFVHLMGASGLWFGLALSPYVSILVGIALFAVVFGVGHFPMLLEEDKDTLYFVENMELTPEHLVNLRREVEALAVAHQLCMNTKLKLMLLVEEMGMLSISKNPNRKLLGEFTLMIGKQYVHAIFKDNGRVLDLTDLEQELSDLRAFLITSLMASHKEKMYLITVSFNRHMFRFPRYETES